MLRKLRAGDYIIFIIILSIALINLAIFMHNSNGKAAALVIKNGSVIRKLNLDEIKSRVELKDIDKYNILIVAENGKIHFEQADCPDRVCVKTGWISKPGQTAACVPAGILIKITGEDSDTDINLK